MGNRLHGKVSKRGYQDAKGDRRDGIISPQLEAPVSCTLGRKSEFETFKDLTRFYTQTPTYSYPPQRKIKPSDLPPDIVERICGKTEQNVPNTEPVQSGGELPQTSWKPTHRHRHGNEGIGAQLEIQLKKIRILRGKEPMTDQFQ